MKIVEINTEQYDVLTATASAKREGMAWRLSSDVSAARNLSAGKCLMFSYENEREFNLGKMRLKNEKNAHKRNWDICQDPKALKIYIRNCNDN